MTEYIYISSIEKKNTINQCSFSYAPRGHLKVDPMQGIFDEHLVVYESYSLLTTHHLETNYVLHAQQQIPMSSFS